MSASVSFVPQGYSHMHLAKRERYGALDALLGGRLSRRGCGAKNLVKTGGEKDLRAGPALREEHEMSTTMRRVAILTVGLLVAGWLPGASGAEEMAVSVSRSGAFRMDVREGARLAGGGAEQVVVSGRWEGGAATAAVDGTVLASVGAGEETGAEWVPDVAGYHVLRHESGGVVMEAGFTVLGTNVVVHAGSVAGSETWEAGKVHLVDGMVMVGSEASLTIESGAVVKFMDGTGLAVASGGSCAANGVIFTHVADDTVGGDTMGDGNETSPVSDRYSVTGSVTMDAGTELRYLTVKTSGTLNTDTVWRGNGVIRVTGNVTVASGATLSVMPGAVVKFNPGVSLTVNSGGTLNAIGTRAQPIVFTSVKDDEHGGDTNGDGDATVAQPGDWAYIRIRGTGAFDHCSVLYASSEENYGGVEAYGGTVTFDNGEIAHMKWDSVNAHSSGTFTLRNTAIWDGSLGFGYYGSGRVKAYNCVFQGLTTAVRQSGKLLVNCVIADCVSFTDQSGDYSSFNHCIFYNPTGYGAQSYSKVGSNGNKWSDPLFVDAENGDFRVRVGSPCIDAGDGTLAPETDYFGRPRMNDPNVADTGKPNADGVCPDIGIYEMEGGNAATDVDLEAVRAGASAEAEVGGMLSVEWTVANAGTEKAAGPWRNVLTLVNEATGETVELSETVSAGGLAGKASKEWSGRFTVPAVSEGDWRVKVQVNAYRDVYEGGAVTNNVILSVGTVRIGVAGLKENGTANGTAWTGAPWTTKVEVPEEGWWMLRVEAPAGSVVRYGVGFVPSEGNASGKATVGADGTALVSLAAGTTVYVTVEGKGTVFVRMLDAALAVSGVSPAELPGSGTTTLTVKGANFEEGAVVSVGGVAAVATEWLNAETLVATVDCASLPAGVCAVEVAQGEQKASLARAVTVNRQAGKADLKAWLEVPKSVRQGRVVTVYVNYENVGNLDMPAPVFEVVSTGQVFMVGGIAYTNSVKVVGLAKEAPVGTLRPGEGQRLAIQATVLSDRVAWLLKSHHAGQAGAGKTRISLGEFYDEDWVLYPAGDDNVVVTRLRAAIGATWAEYYASFAAWLSSVSPETADYETLKSNYGRYQYLVVSGMMTDMESNGSGDPRSNKSENAEEGLRPSSITMSTRGCSHIVTAIPGSKLKDTIDGSIWRWCPTCGKWALAVREIQQMVTPGEAVVPKYEKLEELKSGGMTYVICHGNKNSITWNPSTPDWVGEMARALQASGVANVLAIDWHNGSEAYDGKGAGFFQAKRTAQHVPAVASTAGKMMKELGVVPSSTVLIGHSHGGHVIGHIATSGWGSFNRVVGLDTSRSAVHPNANLKWLSSIGKSDSMVELYRTSWGMSLVGTRELYGKYNFAVVREKDFFDAFEGTDLETDIRHNYSYDWFISTIQSTGSFPNIGFNFAGNDSWDKLAHNNGTKDIRNPGQKGFVGVIRGDRVEMLSALRNDINHDDWNYSETVLSEKDWKSTSPMHLLANNLARTIDYHIASDVLPGVMGGNARLALPSGNCADNKTIPYMNSSVNNAHPSPWPWKNHLAYGVWLVDYEGLVSRDSSCAATLASIAAEGGRVGAARLAELLKGKGDFIRRVGETFVGNPASALSGLGGAYFILPQEGDNGQASVWVRFDNDCFGKDRPLMYRAGTGELKHRRVIAIAGAGVKLQSSTKKNAVPEIYEWDIYPDDNFLLREVTAVPADVYAVISKSSRRNGKSAGARAEASIHELSGNALKPGEIVRIYANSNGAWSIALEATESFAASEEDEITVTRFELPDATGKKGTVGMCMTDFGSGKDSLLLDFPYVTVHGQLPTTLDAEGNSVCEGETYTVQLTVMSSEDEDDVVTCILDVRAGADDDEGEDDDGKDSSVPQSWDPNEMGGPDGVKMVEEGSTNRYVQAGREMEYSIYFENKADAAAAAQEVRVVNPLSEWLDWDSFEMGEVVFHNQVDRGLARKQAGTSEASLEGTGEGVSWKVRTVLGGVTNGVAEWYLRVVDESTADGWPVDPYAGFLPPNDAEGNGEGRLTYKIRVREDAPIGVVISNSAVITFDYNAPLVTDPAWWNIVEAVTNVTLEGVSAEGTRAGDGGLEVVAGKPFGDLLPTPEKTGWTFGGWWTGENGTGTQVTSETVAGADTLTLFAKWVQEVLAELWLDMTQGRVFVGADGVTNGFVLETATEVKDGDWNWREAQDGESAFDAERGALEWTGDTQGVRVFRFRFPEGE